MATAKQKKQAVEDLKKTIVWDMFDKPERFHLELSNGLELDVETLTAKKVLDIASVVGGKLVDIFADTTEDMQMNQIIEIAVKKLDHATLEELAESIFEERRVANLPAAVLMDLVEQYVNKVGIKEVFSAGKKIAELLPISEK